MIVRSFRFVLLFCTRLVATIVSRRIFKICAFAHQLYMHERNRRERGRKNIGKRNESSRKKIVQRVLFGLCKHLPKGVVYVCNDNRHTLMCLFLPSTSIIYEFRSFSLSTANIFRVCSFWSSVLVNQKEKKKNVWRHIFIHNCQKKKNSILLLTCFSLLQLSYILD